MRGGVQFRCSFACLCCAVRPLASSSAAYMFLYTFPRCIFPRMWCTALDLFCAEPFSMPDRRRWRGVHARLAGDRGLHHLRLVHRPEERSGCLCAAQVVRLHRYVLPLTHVQHIGLCFTFLNPACCPCVSISQEISGPVHYYCAEQVHNAQRRHVRALAHCGAQPPHTRTLAFAAATCAQAWTLWGLCWARGPLPCSCRRCCSRGTPTSAPGSAPRSSRCGKRWGGQRASPASQSSVVCRKLCWTPAVVLVNSVVRGRGGCSARADSKLQTIL